MWFRFSEVKEDILIFRRYRISLVLVTVAILISLGMWLYIVRGLAAQSIRTGPSFAFSPLPSACATVVVFPNTQIKQAAVDMAAAQATLNAVEVSGNALQIAQAQQTYQFAKDRYNAMKKACYGRHHYTWSHSF